MNLQEETLDIHVDPELQKQLHSGMTPIYKYIPDPNEFKTDRDKYGDIGNEYIVFSCKEALYGIVVWVKYDRGWIANPFCYRPLIAHLLNRIGN